MEAVADLSPKGRNKLQMAYSCGKAYHSLEDLLKDDKIDAVFIATPAPDHARHTIMALNAGKHVLCAVPVAFTIADCYEVLKTVKRTGLIYMMAETSYFRQSTLTAKNYYEKGNFGNIFNTIAEYSHPGLEDYFFQNNKPTWRHGLPPMFYPTHCIAFLTAVTNERLVSVSCLGWRDQSELLKNNPYSNPFWNERALFRTNKSNSFTVSINWKGSLRNVEKANWEGTNMSLYTSENEDDLMTLVKKNHTTSYDDGGFRNAGSTVKEIEPVKWWQTDLLPKPLRFNSGHGGSHCFITHEFIDSIKNARKPVVGIEEALACTVPGLIAHASALRNGDSMEIPLF